MKTELAEQTFTPIGNQVMIQPIEVEKTKGGIVIPEHLRGRSGDKAPTKDAAMALVVSVGAYCRFVRRGDLVIYHGNLVGFVHKGVKVAICTEQQIVGIERNGRGEMPAFECIDWETQEVHRFEPQVGTTEVDLQGAGSERFEGCLRCGSTAHQTKDCPNSTRGLRGE